MPSKYKYYIAIAFALGTIIGNFFTFHYKEREFLMREDARADVVSMLYSEKTKRRNDSIEYNQIIEQAEKAYYDLLQKK